MRVLVTVKEVATVDDEFEIDGLAVDDRYVTRDLNEWDEYALEAAVRLVEDAGGEVVAVTIGPERTEETVRKVLAKGADRAVRVWDDALAEATTLDAGVTARVLAAVAEREEPDLVLTGVQSADAGLAATGVSMAERLDFGWAAVVNQLSVDREAGTARVHRELEGGLAELTEVDLPAVLTIQTGIDEPRYASLRGIRQAQSKELTHLTTSDLSIDPSALESPIEQTGLSVPTAESEAKLFEGSPDEAAAELAGVFRESGVDR